MRKCDYLLGMLIRRLFDARLAQTSYLVGCQETKEALVVDPNRLIDQYVAAPDPPVVGNALTRGGSATIRR